MVKRREFNHVMYGLERRMQMNLRRRIETPRMAPEPGWPFNSGMSAGETYLLSVRCPVFRRRDSNSGFRMELENLNGDVKREGSSGWYRETDSSDAPGRGGLPRKSCEAE